MNGEQEVKKSLTNAELNQYVTNNLHSTLSSIGYSSELLSDVLNDLPRVDVDAVIQKHSKELHDIHNVHFFEELVPAYFARYVIPEIPSEGKTLDLGCGTGVLIKKIVQERGQEVVGIDISSYPEWIEARLAGVRFEVVGEAELVLFLNNEKPQTVVMTWTLHHMEYAEQERYLQTLYSALESRARFVILEDSYSDTLTPENGEQVYKDFMHWDKDKRRSIMGAYDWVANRILEQRDKVPMPFTYRTVEEWSSLLSKVGFTVAKAKFIGFPENRDINTPQSLLVAVK